MPLFNRQVFRSFGIGFLVGAVGIAIAMGGAEHSTVVPPAVAAVAH